MRSKPDLIREIKSGTRPAMLTTLEKPSGFRAKRDVGEVGVVAFEVAQSGIYPVLECTTHTLPPKT
jgi:hypothetical protein